MWADFPRNKHLKQAIYRGPGGAGDATGDATNASALALAAKDAAQASATSAASSATAAASSATSAASSATDAATSATNASGSASTASTAATNASTYATNAASSATTAASEASDAADSATAAASSATSASTDASTASTQASNASSSASSASTSASTATTKASEAATSATNAASSATTASTQATNASNSASAASTSETNAASSASSASTSASTATTQASNAASSASSASTSASTATTQASNAASSASAASTSASNASTSATNAASSATSAASSATSAASSATAAAASAASIDDSALVHKTGDETIAGLKTFSTGIVLGRVNSASEGGQVDLCRSTDNASAWAVDVYGNTSTPSLRFVDNTASATRMAIDGSGNVGIGTSSPTAKLTVSSTSSVVTNGASTRNPVASLYGGNSNNRLDMYVDNSGGTAIMGLGAYNVAGGATAMTFYTGASVAEAMRIDSSGNLLVGTTTAAGSSSIDLTRSANTATYIHLLKTSQVEASWGFKASTDTNMYIGSGSANVGTYGVYLTNTGSSWNAVSDERMKTIVEPINNALEKVCTLRTVIGYYNNDEAQLRRPFLIAQDVQAVLPEAVNIQDQETGTLGMSYTDTIPLLVAAIKEQQALITQLQADVAALKGQA